MSKVQLITSSNLAVWRIAWIARVSTTPLDKDIVSVINGGVFATPEEHEKDVKLCKHLYTAGHWSVFEHCSLTYLLECSRACSLQLARHRHISRTEMSQRYTKIGGENNDWYVTPPECENSLQFYNQMEDAANVYNSLINLGYKREDARFLLPEATKTRMFITLNLRTLLELTQKRACDPRAQWEIKELVRKMWHDIPSELKEIFRPELKWLDDKKNDRVTPRDE